MYDEISTLYVSAKLVHDIRIWKYNSSYELAFDFGYVQVKISQENYYKANLDNTHGCVCVSLLRNQINYHRLLY